MKFEPKQPWWLNYQIRCSECKGTVTLDNPLDAQELERTERSDYGEQFQIACPGCGKVMYIDQYIFPVTGTELERVDGRG